MKNGEKTVWLVTGGAGALGSALGLALCRRGDEVILLDRDRKGLEATHDRIEQLTSNVPALYPMDLAGASANDYEALFDKLADNFGKLDTLVHGAAELPSFKPMEHMTPPEWFGVLQCALTGPYLLTRALFPLMRKTEKARAVWIIDGPEERQKAFWGAYGVGQAARQALVGIWQQELGDRGPQVLSWVPEPFRSPLRASGRPGENPKDLPEPDTAADALLDWLDSGQAN